MCACFSQTTHRPTSTTEHHPPLSPESFCALLEKVCAPACKMTCAAAHARSLEGTYPLVSPVTPSPKVNNEQSIRGLESRPYSIMPHYPLIILPQGSSNRFQLLKCYTPCAHLQYDNLIMINYYNLRESTVILL